MEADMTKLRLGAILEDKPLKITVEIPARLHRDLTAYATALSRETGQEISDPARLVVPMLERFIATDRGFARTKKKTQVAPDHGGVESGR